MEENITMPNHHKYQCDWHNPRIILMLVGLVLLASVLIVSILRDRFVNQPQWQVQVLGQGRVQYQPDTAVVTLGVRVERLFSAEITLKQLNEKITKAVTAIKESGIPAEDIQTENYTLESMYDYRDGVSIFGGYSANQQLVIKVRKISEGDLVGKVLAAAAKAGINQVNGVSFEVSNLNDLKQEARIKALADAKDRGQDLADAAGVRFGKVVGWWENIVQAPGINVYYGGVDGKGGAAGAMSATPQIPVGTQEIVIEVNLSYQVK